MLPCHDAFAYILVAEPLKKVPGLDQWELVQSFTLGAKAEVDMPTEAAGKLIQLYADAKADDTEAARAAQHAGAFLQDGNPAVLFCCCRS